MSVSDLLCDGATAPASGVSVLLPAGPSRQPLSASCVSLCGVLSGLRVRLALVPDPDPPDPGPDRGVGLMWGVPFGGIIMLLLEAWETSQKPVFGGVFWPSNQRLIKTQKRGPHIRDLGRLLPTFVTQVTL